MKPSLGVAGTKTAEYCTQHAPEGMVKVYNKKCKTETCSKELSYGVATTKMAQCCTQNASEGMVKVYNKTCKTKACGKEPSFGVTNTRTAVYYAQHATLPWGVEGYREREVSPHHSGKETIGNVIPNVAKHATNHLPLTKPRQPAGVSRDSLERVRHPEITSTASKRAVARELPAGAVTMSDIDVKKSPVRRNSSVELEVQLFFQPGTLHVTANPLYLM